MLKDISPERFARDFALKIRDAAKTLAAISGLVDSVRATEDPPNIESIALRVANYAKGIEVVERNTNVAISMVARLAYNRLGELEVDPDFNAILRGNEPQSDCDTVVVAAHARWLLDNNLPVRVDGLAVLANISYANCMMHMHRGNLRGSRGMVTVTSAKEFLLERAKQQAKVTLAKVPHSVRNEAIPRKRRKAS